MKIERIPPPPEPPLFVITLRGPEAFALATFLHACQFDGDWEDLEVQQLAALLWDNVRGTIK